MQNASILSCFDRFVHRSIDAAVIPVLIILIKSMPTPVAFPTIIAFSFCCCHNGMYRHMSFQSTAIHNYRNCHTSNELPAKNVAVPSMWQPFSLLQVYRYLSAELCSEGISHRCTQTLPNQSNRSYYTHACSLRQRWYAEVQVDRGSQKRLYFFLWVAVTVVLVLSPWMQMQQTHFERGPSYRCWCKWQCHLVCATTRQTISLGTLLNLNDFH